jgi:hypothetical protein
MVRSGLSSKQPRRWLKVANLGSLELSNLTVHGVYFESTVGILTNRIKGWNFSPVNTRLLSSSPYK